MKRCILLVCLAGLFACAVTCAGAVDYNVVDLGTLPGDIASWAYGINNAGQVVGESHGTSRYHAFLWQNGNMTNLGTLGGTVSYAYGINDSGQVVGFADTSSGDQHAFLWQNGTMTDLGRADASAINNIGEIAGDGDYYACVWQSGAVTDLGTLPGYGSTGANGINDSGQVVGLVVASATT